MKDRTWWLIVVGFSVFSFAAGWIGAGLAASYDKLLAATDHGLEGTAVTPVVDTSVRTGAVDGGASPAPGSP